MVRVIGYKKRMSENNKEFFALEVQGGVETVKSEKSGNYYFTAKRAYVASSFNEVTCKGLIGSEIPGSIVKESCDPFDYTILETGETLQLDWRYVFVPEEMVRVSEIQHAQTNIKANAEVFSSNEPEIEYE